MRSPRDELQDEEGLPPSELDARPGMEIGLELADPDDDVTLARGEDTSSIMPLPE